MPLLIRALSLMMKITDKISTKFLNRDKIIKKLYCHNNINMLKSMFFGKGCYLYPSPRPSATSLDGRTEKAVKSDRKRYVLSSTFTQIPSQGARNYVLHKSLFLSRQLYAVSDYLKLSKSTPNFL